MSTGGWAERDALLAELVRLACSGNSRFAAIEAPAGYGKTPLLDGVRLRAQRAGMQVLTARGSGTARDYAFSIPRALFAPVLAVNGFEADGFARQAIDDPTAAAQLFGQLAVGLAREQPLCLAIEDAHMADAASTDWLAEVFRQADDVPLLVVLAGRRRPSGAIDLLLDRPGVIALRLAALSAAEVLARTSAVVGAASDELSRSVFAVTGGVPYLVDAVLEAVAATADRRPENDDELIQLSLDQVAGVVRTRVARGGDAALAIAQAAAVLEADAERIRVAALSGLPQDVVATVADTLADDGFVSSGWPMRFAQPIVEQAVRASLTAAERSQFHATAAAVLTADRAPHEVIGRHIMQAEPVGDRDRVDVLRSLARAASDRDQPELAVGYLRRALREQPSILQLPAVTLELGRAEARIEPAAAIERLEQAADLCADQTMRRQALGELAHVLVVAGQFAHAAEIGERLLASLDDDDPARLGVLAQLLMTAQLAAIPAASTEDRLRQMNELMARGAPAEACTLATLAVAELNQGGGRGRVISLGRRALDQDGSTAPRRPWLLLALRALDGAGELTDLGPEDAECELVRVARVAYGRGDLRRVVELVDSARATDAADVNVIAELAVIGASAYVDLGQIDAARDLLATIAPLDGDGAAVSGVAALYVRGQLRLAEGADEAGIADILEAGDRLVAAGVVNPAACGWRGIAAIALAGRGDRVRAQALADEEVARAESFGAPRPLGVALMARGLVRGAAAGRHDLSTAVDVLATTPDRLAYGRALLALGGAERRAGQRRSARETLFHARRLADECGAQPLVVIADDELRLAGARLVQRPQRGAAALTPAERRVAMMAAGGATNAEVASALFLSRKTVEMHLSRVYRKLNITRRRDLPAALSEEAA